MSTFARMPLCLYISTSHIPVHFTWGQLWSFLFVCFVFWWEFWVSCPLSVQNCCITVPELGRDASYFSEWHSCFLRSLLRRISLPACCSWHTISTLQVIQVSWSKDKCDFIIFSLPCLLLTCTLCIMVGYTKTTPQSLFLLLRIQSCSVRWGMRNFGNLLLLQLP